MERLARFTVRRRRAVLAVSGVLFLVFGAAGASVQEAMSSGGFDAEGAEATRTAKYLEDKFGAGDVDLMLLVTAKAGSVDDPATAEAGRRLTEAFAGEQGVTEAFSYWTLDNAPPMRSTDAKQALVVARLEGNQNEMTETVERLGPRYRFTDELLDVKLSGYGEIFREVGHQSERDLQRAELIVVPLTAILLLFIFRSAVAAALPLVVGGLAVVGTMFILRVLASLTEVSVFALNMTTAMGLGLGVDYSLFVVSRFREELTAGHTTEDAVVRAVRTAGRMVIFSGITVAASLVALLVFPLAFLRSFGFAGIAVVTLASTASVITLPALLATLGPKIDRWSVRRAAPAATGPSPWRRLGGAVMARPGPVAVVSVALLLLLGVPFLRIELGLPDERVLPKDSPPRQVVEEFQANFSASEAFPTLVAVPGIGDPIARGSDIDAYAGKLSTLPGVARVDAATGSYAQGARVAFNENLARRFLAPDATYLSVVPSGSLPPYSPRAVDLIETIRSDPAPFSGVEVTGRSAAFVDSKTALFSRLPLAALIIAIVTFVVLFLAFGSLLVPLKAFILNLLSLTATFGAMVWIFQDGHFADFLGFTPRETIDIFNPILMFAIAFGLSMDYEVFLLSRIKEEHDRTGDNTESVVAGMERTGRLITAAALLVAAVFIGFGTSRVSIIKLFGLGLALAVLMDAFVIRTFLVPAFMRLAGEWNWWAPPWLRRVHDRIGISESDPPMDTDHGTRSGEEGGTADRARTLVTEGVAPVASAATPPAADAAVAPKTGTAPANGARTRRAARSRTNADAPAARSRASGENLVANTPTGAARPRRTRRSSDNGSAK
jgi:putative drug exporter of the RND superfamily